MINIKVENKIALSDVSAIVNDNSDYIVHFIFDDEWKSEYKTMRVAYSSDSYNDIVFSGTDCALPRLSGDSWIYIGCYEDNIRTTTPAVIKVRKSIISDGGIEKEPTKDVYSQIMVLFNDTTSNITEVVTDAQQAAESARDVSVYNASIATEKATEAIKSADNANDSKDVAEVKAEESVNASVDAINAKNQATQAYADFLSMLGTDVATLDSNGKIPANQIPSIATTETYTVDSQEAMDNLQVQNGDICIRTDENKSYIYSNGGWVYLTTPTDYASEANHAISADTADNSTMINNHRLVEMSASEFATAVKDSNTYYLVWGD